MRFDTEAYLQSRSIPYNASGKNISHGWIGLKCPFCNDPSTHFGINLESGNFSCWICKSKGWAYDFIMAYEGVEYGKAKQIAREFLTGTPYKGPRKPQDKKIEMHLPTIIPGDLPPAFQDYLDGRGFGSDIAQRYGLLGGYYTGPYAYRIIIPFYRSGLLSNFVARDITGKQEPRYKNCPNQLALIPTKHSVYNIDNASRRVAIVEGPTDLWRLGGSVVSTLGTTFTAHQVLEIKNAGVEEAVVIFDGEKKATKAARQLSSFLNLCGITASVREMERDRDPGSLSDQEAYELRKEVGLTLI